MFEFDQTAYILAQSGPATEGDGSQETTGQTDGSSGGTNSASPGGGLTMWLPLLGIMFLLIFFSFRGQRKERKRREAMLASVKKHDKVQTIGGIIGSVVEIKPTSIVLKVDESSNTRMTFARSAVQQVLTDTAEER